MKFTFVIVIIVGMMAISALRATLGARETVSAQPAQTVWDGIYWDGIYTEE